MSKPVLLLTNDDGVNAPGLAALADALNGVGEVWVYAPDRDQSAVGHGISLHRPLRVRQVRERWYMVDGTPTDCVMLAVRDLLKKRPRVILSGINNGPNLGDDVTYSGTVAGAFEGMLLGIPSMAVSLVNHTPNHFACAAEIARQLVTEILQKGLPPDTALNVNVPDVPHAELKGISVTRMGRRTYEDEIIHREDPRGALYYWIGGDQPGHVVDEGTDFEAIDENRVSITPLHRDLTNFSALKQLKEQRFGQ